VIINSHGMRYREVSRDPTRGVLRVAVLGDSNAWGIDAAEGERFTERVEKAADGAYELLNFGVSGYGPVQFHLMLDGVLAFRPKAVVLSFCLGNDFADNVFWRRYGYYKPFVVRNGSDGPVVEGYPLPNVLDFSHDETSVIGGWMHDRSRLYRATRLAGTRLYRAVGRVGRRTGPGASTDPGQRGLVGLDESQRDLYFPERSTPEARSLADKAVAVNGALLTAIRDRLRREGVPFAVVVAPSKCEFGACFPGENAVNLVVRDRLLATLKELAIDALDPTGEMTLGDFWAIDGHWRPSGHDKIARLVRAWLDLQPLPSASRAPAGPSGSAPPRARGQGVGAGGRE